MEWFRPTIEINGFSMVLGSGNHWKRWFSMVFDGFPPLVQRWNGYLPSLKSNDDDDDDDDDGGESG